MKESNSIKWHEKDSFVCRPLPLDPEKYSNPDNDPRGPWKADPFDAPNIRPNLTYPVTNPNTGDQHLPPRGRHWRISPEKFASASAEGRIIWGSNGLGRPQMKVFYEEKKEFGSIDNSWFSADRIGTSTAGTKELMSMFDGYAFFDTPKPTSMIKKMINLSYCEQNDIVLDFFSGSATTAEAVMRINAESNENIKFIMVQLPESYEEDSEAYKAGYKTICEIGEERIRRAGEKIRKEYEENKASDGLLIEGKDFSVDIGFRVFKLDSTNINPWDNTKEHDEQTIFDTLTVFKHDRSKEDILYEIMLKYGIFDQPVSEVDINGKTMYRVGQRHMIVCLEDNIDDKDVAEIAKLQARVVVFKEDGFKDDNAKINAEYNLKNAGVEDVKCI